jgi:hypothetical protein
LPRPRCPSGRAAERHDRKGSRPRRSNRAAEAAAEIKRLAEVQGPGHDRRRREAPGPTGGPHRTAQGFVADANSNHCLVPAAQNRTNFCSRCLALSRRTA